MTYRNPALLKACRLLPCQRCGAQDGAVVAAHPNQLRDGKGRSIKASDARVAALCFKCHGEIDQGAAMSRAQRIEAWEEAHRATLGTMIEQGILKI